MAELYRLFFIIFFTTTSFLFNLRIFSLIIKLLSNFLISILTVLLKGNRRFTTELDLLSSFLIIKVNDVKSESIKIDKDVQLEKMSELERERQFTTFSTLY